jgi:hypothetical protein
MPDEENEHEQEYEPADPTVWPGATGKQAAFLNALVMFAGHRTKAARAARVSRSITYRWQEESAEYLLLFERAQRQAFGTLEDEMIRRAQFGVPKGIYYQGSRVAFERVYSDGLMMMLARAGDPKYRSSEVQVKGGIDLKFAGPMEELLSLYRNLTKAEPAE